MNIKELKDKFYKNNVPKRWYSLNEGLKNDACILVKSYSYWEFFYLDERGNKNDLKIFNNEEGAFDCLWEKMKNQLKVFNIKPRE